MEALLLQCDEEKFSIINDQLILEMVLNGEKKEMEAQAILMFHSLVKENIR
jgi:hypothetical protein